MFPKTHQNGKNIWILKPAAFNRGRGIRVFDKLSTLNAIIDKKKQKIKTSQIPSRFVIQKYIEKPLLIENRKFDIRMWVLFGLDNKVYMFKEGYLRTSSVEYDFNNLENEYVHLTNNAV